VPFHGGLQRHVDGVPRPALVQFIQPGAPPIEQPQAFLPVADLVAEVIGPPAEGVQVVEVLVEPR